MRRFHLRCLRSIAVVLLAVPAASHAASCVLSVATLNFGSYTGSQATASGTMTLTCTKSGPPAAERVDYVVSLSTGGSASYAQRLMARTSLPADNLAYNLYQGSVPGVLNTNVWGDGSGGTVRWTGRMNLTNGNPIQSESTTLAGAIPAGLFPSAGNYQDIVTATVVIN